MLAAEGMGEDGLCVPSDQQVPQSLLAKSVRSKKEKRPCYPHTDI